MSAVFVQMDPSIWGLIVASILFILFAAIMIWVERGRFKQKAGARQEAKEILESGRIDDIERFEYICRVLLMSMTSVFKDREAAGLYHRLQDLRRAGSKQDKVNKVD